MTKVGVAAVHKNDCAYINLHTRTKNAQVFPAQWEKKSRTHGVPITLAIYGQDRVGLLQDITSMVSELGMNMRSLNASQQDGQAILSATVEIHSLQEVRRT